MRVVPVRRFVRLMAVAGAVLVAGPATAAAAPAGAAPSGVVMVNRDGQQVRIRAVSGADTRALTGATATTPQGPARFDLDGDGIDDVVAGAWCYDEGYCVAVRYSHAARTDLISAPITSPTRPNFGDALSAGDFNHDGYVDLAVSNEGEFVPPPGDVRAFGGAVWVFSGGPNGLDTGTVQHFNLNTPGIPYDMQPYGVFGSALAAGDLNGDGFADLAVGAAGQNVAGVTYAGLVIALYGSPAGLTTTGVQALIEGAGGVPGPPRAYDRFGTSVAIGDATGDGYADLAAGAVQDSLSPNTGGMVVVLRGSAGGLGATGSSVVYGQRDLSVSTLGDALAIADINADGHADVLAPTPRFNGGALAYLPGTASGIGAAGARVITRKTPGVPPGLGNHTDDGISDSFGSSIATGDVTGDGLPDVLLGANTTNDAGVAHAGSVYLIPAASAGLTGAGSVVYWQGLPAGPPGTRTRPNPAAGFPPVYDGAFGQSVAILNLDGTGALDLLVGTDRYDPTKGVLQQLSLTGSSGAAGARNGLAAYLRPGGHVTGDSLAIYSLGSTLLHG